MRYNLSAFEVIFDKTIPSYMEWREGIHDFFNNENYDSAILDEYYNHLIEDIWSIYELVRKGYLIEPHSGLFTFDNPEMKGIHSFNLANMVRRNHQYFHNKKLRTITTDYGMVNIQIKLCGLELHSALMPKKNLAGAVLATIGNKSYPYSFVDDIEADVVLAANVFDNPEYSLTNWESLLANQEEGREVFFTTNTFGDLKNFIDYSKIELVENPSEIYDDDAYSNLDLGLSNKIYKLI